jgi:hypothetical protein
MLVTINDKKCDGNHNKVLMILSLKGRNVCNSGLICPTECNCKHLQANPIYYNFMYTSHTQTSEVECGDRQKVPCPREGLSDILADSISKS